MNTSRRIPIYLMPGMAASPNIFDGLRLPEEEFSIHFLHWIMPENKETLSHYAKRMCKQVKHEDIVLLGVSFGGMLVQEMAAFVKAKKVIVVSSVCRNYQMPKRFKFSRKTKLHKLLPIRLLSRLDLVEKYTYGRSVKKRVKLYRKYLSVSYPYYLSWALDQIVNWKEVENTVETIQIHGDRDGIFTRSIDENCIVVERGTHLMILEKARWFNEHLPRLICQ